MRVQMLIRQPFRFLFCFSFFLFVSAPTLYYVLQFDMDRAGISYIADVYAPVGTIINNQQANESKQTLLSLTGSLTPIYPDALAFLEDSPNIGYVEMRRTRSAHLEEQQNLLLFFLTDTAQHITIFDAVADSSFFQQHPDTFPVPSGDAFFSNLNFWVRHPSYVNESGSVFFQFSVPDDGRFTDTNPPIMEGDRYLITSVYMILGADGTAQPASVYIWQPEADFESFLVANASFFKDILPNAILPLSANADNEEIEQLLREKDMWFLVEQSEQMSHVFTVHESHDMNLLLPFSQGRMYIAEGRPLTPGDRSQHVCVISNRLAASNGIQIGDRLQISLADDCYVIDGYETGFPALGNRLSSPYGNSEGYEVVGTYDYLNYVSMGQPFLFSYNDIFIPDGVISSEGSSNFDVYPYAFSFRVNGSRLDHFYREDKRTLETMGYDVQLVESNWDDVADIYAEMSFRQFQMFFAAVFFFFGGSTLYAALILALYRREYALRKLLGTGEEQARKAFTTPFLLGALPAAVLSSSALLCIYAFYLRPRTERIMLSSTHSVTFATLLLSVSVLLEIGTGFCMLLMLYRRVKRKAVRLLLFS